LDPRDFEPRYPPADLVPIEPVPAGPAPTDPVPIGPAPLESLLRRPRRRRRRILGVAAGAVACLALLTVGGVYVLGDMVVPVGNFVVGARTIAGGGPGAAESSASTLTQAQRDRSAAILNWLQAADWSAPETLPEGYYMVAFDLRTWEDAEFVVVDAVTPSGRVSYVQHHARIDSEQIGSYELRQIGGRDVYCSTDHGQLAGAFETGYDTVAFVSNTTEAELEIFVASTPPPTPDGLSERMRRGWYVFQHILG